jgi:5-methylcytosine-specific restriction endonuclease McrA
MRRKEARSAAERRLIQRTIAKAGRCAGCGATTDLQGHHKVPKAVDMSLALEPTNIEVLCANCHGAEHEGIKGFIVRPRRRTGQMVPCSRCGTPTYRKASRLGQAAFYCSQACLHAGEARNCQICGNAFYAKRKHILRNEGRFCSLVCFGKANGPRAAAVRWKDRPPRKCSCAECGSTFRAAHANPAKYCSLSCFGKANMRTRAGGDDRHAAASGSPSRS